ncbi:hypothetical protein [Halarcobacter anaerophilus]|uniref:hypothetical protein n=1 Tax=Halarcobacter anaerophilus TaxID=877500 RepID=UPI0005CB607F|nr:hypothetical protein [Halarcobacter anaerophilus]
MQEDKIIEVCTKDQVFKVGDMLGDEIIESIHISFYKGGAVTVHFKSGNNYNFHYSRVTNISYLHKPAAAVKNIKVEFNVSKIYE